MTDIPEIYEVYTSSPFTKYSKISNSKWPCCCDNCTVYLLKNINDYQIYYKLECTKHKKLKKDIYSQEEFDKMLRFTNYLNGMKYQSQKNTNYILCQNGHILSVRCIEKNSRSCNICNNNIVKNINKVWSCIDCGYDVCLKCQTTHKKSSRKKSTNATSNNTSEPAVAQE
jgi:hypothetical protein